MNAIEWIKNHTQHTEINEFDGYKWQTSIFTGKLNPKMRSDIFSAFRKLEIYDISGSTRIYNGLKLSIEHDVKSQKTTLIFVQAL